MEQKVEVGDLFRDNDKRLNGSRVIKVVSIERGRNTDYAVIENVEHWDERQIGRKSRVMVGRLKFGAGQQTGYTKVSH